MYLHRTLEKNIKKISNQFPVLILTGARQVGKTTLLKFLSEKERQYITLDDLRIRELAKNDPPFFLQKYRPPILIDEIQYAPQLLPYIKMEVDKRRDKGLFWLIGSQPFHLMRDVSESLAGRAGILRLYGFSFDEIKGKGDKNLPFPESLEKKNLKSHLSLNDVMNQIWLGSYPALFQPGNPKKKYFYDSYIQTYIQRDVRDLTKVGDELAFLRFLRACAARTGQLLNLSELARDSDIAVNTAKNWLSILRTSGIIFLLEPFHNNYAKRMIKAPKLYFLDTGLASYLTEWNSPETLESGAMSGAFLETWIVVEILKSRVYNGLRPSLYFYRDRDSKEIDLLIEKDNTIYPFEIKKTASPNSKDIKSFKSLEKLNKRIGAGGIICFCNISFPLDAKHSAIPIGYMFS